MTKYNKLSHNSAKGSNTCGSLLHTERSDLIDGMRYGVESACYTA